MALATLSSLDFSASIRFSWVKLEANKIGDAPVCSATELRASMGMRDLLGPKAFRYLLNDGT
jgi:hypothetical protein